MKKILVIGASGQIGVELTLALRALHGGDQVIASNSRDEHPLLVGTGPFTRLDVMNKAAVQSVVEECDVGEIYLLAALLSATGEKDPNRAWDLNIGSLRQVLDLAVEKKLKLFCPSSIALFVPTTPRDG